MKRLFVMCILVLGAGLCTLKAEDKADSTKTEGLMTTVYGDAKDALKGLGEALKVGAEHVYIVLVKQQVVKSSVYILLLIIGIIMSIMAYKQFGKTKWSDYGDLKEGGRSLGYAIGLGFIGIINLLIGMVNIETIMTGFINPEYGAIRDIMNFVKK